ncbi:hypothetical protein ACFL6H_10385, partial [Candidatus Latescibacterota bacterium]
MNIILKELKQHAGFTLFGAFAGILIMVFTQKIPSNISYKMFYIFHPAHVFFSAMATASMFRLHQKKNMRNILLKVFIVGFFGSIGIATLSDSLIPYLGEYLLNLPKRAAHIGFIEEWWLVNPLAVFGIIAAYFHPTTKLTHMIHVLISTWASLFHIIMAFGDIVTA